MEPIDERNAEIAALKAALESFSKMAKELKKERDKATEDATNYYARLGEVEKERDEAIADRDIARLAALESDKAHDRMVGELEKVYKERDEARADATALAERLTALELSSTSELARLERERDEAGEALAAEIKHHTETTAKWNGHHMDLTMAQCDLNKALRERDEAREHYHQVCYQTLIEVNKAHEERDEAREEVDRYREKLDLSPIHWEV